MSTAATSGALDYDSGPPVERELFATWLFLAAEAMFFAGLLATYFVLESSAAGWPGAAGRLHVGASAGATALLVASSWTASRALRGERSRGWIAATLVLGLVFLALQAREWSELVANGMRPSSDLFASSFYVITGAHGLHVLGGLAWFAWLALAQSRVGLRAATLYWHFVDVVWIVLYAVLYLAG